MAAASLCALGATLRGAAESSTGSPCSTPYRAMAMFLENGLLRPYIVDLQIVVVRVTFLAKSAETSALRQGRGHQLHVVVIILSYHEPVVTGTHSTDAAEEVACAS
jgi:hypothetical protein